VRSGGWDGGPGPADAPRNAAPGSRRKVAGRASPTGAWEVTRCWSDAGDVGGEEVHAVAVEVAAGAVVPLGGAGVGVAGQDLGVAQRDACVQGVGYGVWRSEWGLMCRGICAALAIRATIR